MSCAQHPQCTIPTFRCSRESPSGNLVWQGNSSGVLDLKSAYKVSKKLISASASFQAEQPDNACLRRFWAQVWKLPIPRKIEIFIRRGYHDGLPTGSQLRRRNLAVMHLGTPQPRKQAATLGGLGPSWTVFLGLVI
ncbi:hypothetical protein QQ045_028041 [Rhodiola kirilowii]